MKQKTPYFAHTGHLCFVRFILFVVGTSLEAEMLSSVVRFVSLAKASSRLRHGQRFSTVKLLPEVRIRNSALLYSIIFTYCSTIVRSETLLPMAYQL